MEGDAPAAKGLDFFRHAASGLVVYVGDGYVCTLLRHTERDGASDALASAGYERCPA